MNYVSVYFKFKGEISCLNLKTTVEDLSLAMLEEKLYKKLALDESKVKLALRCMSLVYGSEEQQNIRDDDDLFGFLRTVDKDNRRSLLLVEEASRSDQLEKVSRVGISSYGMNYEVLQGDDDNSHEVGPKAITLYVGDGQAYQQKQMIVAGR